MSIKTRDMTLIGDRKLAKKFERLASQAVRNRVVRRPMSGALTPINRAAKANVPVRRGFLKKAIGKKVKTYPGGVWGGVGPRTGGQFEHVDERGRRHVPANYSHLVEFGTEHSRAEPFLRPALDQNKQKALTILRTGVGKNIEKEARKT